MSSVGGVEKGVELWWNFVGGLTYVMLSMVRIVLCDDVNIVLTPTRIVRVVSSMIRY